MCVKFYLDAFENQKGEHPIRVSLSIHGQRIITTIGLSVHPSNWINDPSIPLYKGRWVKSDTCNSAGLSAGQMNGRLRRIVKYFDGWEASAPDYPDKALLILQLKYATGKKRIPKAEGGPKKATHYLVSSFDEYLTCQPQTRQWSFQTLKAHKTLRRHLIDGFGSKTLDYFNENGLNAFIHYLRYDKNMTDNTVRKMFISFKSFLNWAYENHYTSIDSIRFFHPRFIIFDRPVIHLDKEELQRLWNLRIPSDGEVVQLKNKEGISFEKIILNSSTLEKAKDLFLFQCMTSLRYEDLSSVRWSNIRDNKLFVVTEKTHNPVVIELNRYARELLDKYKDSSFPFDRALPSMSNQEMNRALKIISQMCHFDEEVTFTYNRGGKRIEKTMPKYQCLGTHMGRKTFISLSLSEGIPMQVVRNWSGHRTEESMQPYVAITDKARSESMIRFENSLGLDAQNGLY